MELATIASADLNKAPAHFHPCSSRLCVWARCSNDAIATADETDRARLKAALSDRGRIDGRGRSRGGKDSRASIGKQNDIIETIEWSWRASCAVST